jgi:regulator of cell morphogenesis and NO signaling
MDRIDTATRPLDALCHEVIARYHAPLHRRLPRLRAALDRLAGDGARGDLAVLRAAFGELADRLESHMAKEEHLLFPAILAIAGAGRDSRDRPPSPFVTVLHPIRMLEAEHAAIEAGLDQVRALAREVESEGAGTPAWRRCVADLAELHAELREHHRTENEVLFPRALEAERRLP